MNNACWTSPSCTPERCALFILSSKKRISHSTRDDLYSQCTSSLILLGEFAAFLTGANLIMEYVFSNAAVARSLTAYLGTAVGVDAASKWRIAVPGLPSGFNQIDLVAVAVILIISICICYR
jgi:hypothetical protein